jgi:hypothetical protein
MNEKTKKVILYSSLATILAFIIVAIAKKKKDKPTTSGGGSGSEESGGGFDVNINDPCAGRNKDTSAYGLKVMSLQRINGITGCDVDGFAGPKTNGIIKIKHSTLFSRLGNVSPSNIDEYLEASRVMANAQEDISFVNKVKELQKLLGMPSSQQTGFAGDITHGKLQSKYPNEYARYGRIGSTNIDTYLNIAKSRIPTFGQ